MLDEHRHAWSRLTERQMSVHELDTEVAHKCRLEYKIARASKSVPHLERPLFELYLRCKHDLLMLQTPADLPRH